MKWGPREERTKGVGAEGRVRGAEGKGEGAEGIRKRKSHVSLVFPSYPATQDSTLDAKLQTLSFIIYLPPAHKLATHKTLQTEINSFVISQLYSPE